MVLRVDRWAYCGAGRIHWPYFMPKLDTLNCRQSQKKLKVARKENLRRNSHMNRAMHYLVKLP